MSKRISRSTFVKGLAAAGIAGMGAKIYFDAANKLDKIHWSVSGPSRRLGHKLRDGAFSESAAQADLEKVKVLIVGAGIAGLSAAWWLKRQGLDDFVLLEMEQQIGGNSCCGKNQISAYPWGAHYVPIANEEASYVRDFFLEQGIICSHDKSGLPVYNELYLCHDPQERLFKDGNFQEGLVPKRGLQPEDHLEIARFFELIADWRAKKGKDGKPAFAIPLDLSSQDADILSLDQISMAEWFRLEKFTSRPLRWYLNYCCRDDYGSTIENVSAWAGLHYFAGRRGRAANAEANSVLTWPEGNGFLVSKLKSRLGEKIRTGSMAFRVYLEKSGAVCRFVETKSTAPGGIQCAYLIFAGPRFIARRIISDYGQFDPNDARLDYAPWLVANISLRKLPDTKGDSIAWDNVSYYSDSLGYVVATHQDISTRSGQTVITYYYPLSAQDPTLSRRKLENLNGKEWVEKIRTELEKMHPGISEDIISIELWPWGHGMVRPSPGFIWGAARAKMKDNMGAIFFAHSDMSGISNFEEAQFQGVEAARKVLARLRES